MRSSGRMAQWVFLGFVCSSPAAWSVPPGTEGVREVASPEPSERDAPSWWRLHRAVAFEVRWDLDQKFAGADLVAGEAPAAVVDSLRARLQTWSLPPRTWPSQERPEYVRTVVLATDRTAAASRESGLRLPPEVRSRLERAPFDCWLAARRAVDPGFSLDEFTAGGALAFEPAAAPARAAAAAAALSGRREGCASGTLAESPGGRWVLDPFANLELGCLDAPSSAARVNVGYAVHAASPGARVFEASTGLHDVAMGAWLDDDRCLLAGESDVVGPAPKRPAARVPTVWVVDMERRTRTQFQGVPAAPQALDALERGVTACMQKAYPGVRFE